MHPLLKPKGEAYGSRWRRDRNLEVNIEDGDETEKRVSSSHPKIEYISACISLHIHYLTQPMAKL